ncbi:type II secretion system protein J [Chloroflexota bacterium]
MKTGEKGFTLNEVLVSLLITALIAASALMVIYQTVRGNEHNTDYMTSVGQAANAGFRISRDVMMAHSVSTDNLTPPDFIVLNWTVWDESDEPVYHSVKYSFEDVINNVGTLFRYHWSSDGSNYKTMVARNICYDSTNTTYTSRASYEKPLVALTITSFCDDIMESKDYMIMNRSDY